MFGFCFDFKKKTICDITDMLSQVKFVVSPHEKISCNPEECKVVKLFANEELFIAYPVAELGSITFIEMEEVQGSTKDFNFHRGRILWRGETRHFSIRDEIMYIGLPKE